MSHNIVIKSKWTYKIQEYLGLLNVQHTLAMVIVTDNNKVYPILYAQEIRLLPEALSLGLTFVPYRLKDDGAENIWNPRYQEKVG